MGEILTETIVFLQIRRMELRGWSLCVLEARSPDSEAVVLKLGCLLEFLGELLEIQMLRPHIQPNESGSLGTGCRHQYFAKHSRLC